MAEPFLAELRLMSFGFPPKGWATCSGQLLPINQNQALFALLGTQYGGNGQTNFALPDLRGRAPLGVGFNYTQGQMIGQEFHTVSIGELPTHQHQWQGSSATGAQPAPSRLAQSNNTYRAPSDLVALNAGSVANVGGSQPHENRPPSLVLQWCIALQGIFPSQS